MRPITVSLQPPLYLAAENRARWGRFATLRFLARRQVPTRLYQLACVLRAEEQET